MAKMIVGISVYQSDGGWSEIYPLVGSQGQQITLPAASDTVAGIIKAYNATGNNTNGTMTQKAITSAIQTAIANINFPTATKASSTVAGIAKLYDTTGNNADGAMTQKAVQQAINNIPSVKQASSTVAGVARLYDSTGNNTNGAMTQAAVTNALNDLDTSSFDTVVVNSTNLKANSANGTTITFVQGNNVNISANAANNRITISATDTTYPVASTTKNGLMTSDDKINLNNLSVQVAQLPIGNSTVSIATKDWSSSVQAVNGVGYHTCTKSLSTLKDDHPVIYLGASGSNIIPTEAEEAAYGNINYVTVDTSAKTIKFYAKAVPNTALTILVKNCINGN